MTNPTARARLERIERYYADAVFTAGPDIEWLLAASRRALDALERIGESPGWSLAHVVVERANRALSDIDELARGGR